MYLTKIKAQHEITMRNMDVRKKFQFFTFLDEN